MTETSPILVLISEVERGFAVWQRLAAFYRDYCARQRPFEHRQVEQAIVVADVFVSSYTCVETMFLRVSQFFENRLDAPRWHQDLLHKMSLEIPGLRERVLSEPTLNALQELLRFRHFKRYYFEFNYDWDRLELVRRKYEQAQELLPADLDRFLRFLRRLAAPIERGGET